MPPRERPGATVPAADDTLPEDPFSTTKTLTNCKAVFRHASGPGNTYTRSGHTYKDMVDLFSFVCAFGV